MHTNYHLPCKKRARLQKHLPRTGSVTLLHQPAALRAAVLAVFLAVFALSSISTAYAESKTLQWNRLDCDITVQPNGDLHVVETNVIQFTSGSFTFGYRDINQDRLTDITDIQATQDSKPLKYETSTTDSGDFRIKYYFNKAQNEVRTFKLAYTVIGATRYYTNGDVIYWAPVYASRNGFEVHDSRTTVNLPKDATALVATTFGPKTTVAGEGESQVVAVSQEPIPSGQQLEILVSIPHGILTGKAPDWQADYDKSQAAKVASHSSDFVFLLMGSLFLFGGPAAVIWLWFTRGRDPHIAMVADYLNEPPTGITPGMAGTLIDGTADLQDMIATVVDLGRRGFLTLHEQGTANAAGSVVARDYLVVRADKYKSVKLSPYETKLVAALGLDNQKATTLSAIERTLSAQVKNIKTTMYEELVRMGMYSRNPEGPRSTYSLIGVLLIILACVASCVTAWFAENTSGFVFCLPLGIGVSAILLLILSGRMQARTPKGAEARMRVDAFKKYLQNIEKYTDIKTAKDLFNKYLPYAIAFGLDRTWIQKFTAIQAPAPAWYIPYIDLGTRGSIGDGSSVISSGAGVARAASGASIGDISGAAMAPLSMDRVSEGLSSSLSDVDKGLSTMFTSVSASFMNKPLNVVNAAGAVAQVASSSGSSSTIDGLKVAGDILGVVLDIAVGGGGSSGGGGGGFG